RQRLRPGDRGALLRLPRRQRSGLRQRGGGPRPLSRRRGGLRAHELGALPADRNLDGDDPVKPSTRASIAAAAAGLCGLLWWLSLRAPAADLGARHETTAEIAEPATVPAAPTPPAPVLNASVAPPRAEQPADGDVEEDPHPHPLTPER